MRISDGKATQALKMLWPCSLSAALFALPPFPGKFRLVDAFGKLASRMGDAHTVFSVLRGVRLEVDLRDRIQRHMWGGCYEPHVRKCCEALLTAGDVFLDIGAHIGYHTLFAACLVGPQGKVFAFEPDPVLHATLAHNASQFSWVVTLPYAVWESSRTLTFERSSFASESGWGTLCTVRDLRKGEHAAVKAVSLDDWIAEFPLGAIDVIKVDAEGSEMAILTGARDTLNRFRPIIVVEVNDILLREAGSSGAELAEHLISQHYRLYGLSWHRLKEWEPRGGSGFGEVICIPEEEAEHKLAVLRAAGFAMRARPRRREQS